MRKAAVYSNQKLAGYLTENDDNTFTFVYDKEYLVSPGSDAISLTLPLRTEPYQSDTLFPFIFNMLSEGDNKAIQCRRLKIDENDFFGLLLATAGIDTIGAITVTKTT